MRGRSIFISGNCCLLLFTFIVTTSTSKSKLINVLGIQGRKFTVRNYTIGVIVREASYGVAGNVRQLGPTDWLEQVGNLSERHSEQNHEHSVVHSLPSSSRTMTNASSFRDAKERCLPISFGALSNIPSVNLLRISSQFFQGSGSSTPLTFSVDSTIYRIIIEVNGTQAIDTTILDPTGAMLNKRLRRSAESAPRDKHQTSSFSHPLPMLSRRSQNTNVAILRKQSAFWKKQHLNDRIQSKMENKQHKHSTLLMIPDEDVRDNEVQYNGIPNNDVHRQKVHTFRFLRVDNKQIDNLHAHTKPHNGQNSKQPHTTRNRQSDQPLDNTHNRQNDQQLHTTHNEQSFRQLDNAQNRQSDQQIDNTHNRHNDQQLDTIDNGQSDQQLHTIHNEQTDRQLDKAHNRQSDQQIDNTHNRRNDQQLDTTHNEQTDRQLDNAQNRQNDQQLDTTHNEQTDQQYHTGLNRQHVQQTLQYYYSPPNKVSPQIQYLQEKWYIKRNSTESQYSSQRQYSNSTHTDAVSRDVLHLPQNYVGAILSQRSLSGHQPSDQDDLLDFPQDKFPHPDPSFRRKMITILPRYHPYRSRNRTGTRQNSNNNSYSKYRQKRSATISSLVESEGAVVWEVEPPITGIWTIAVYGIEPVGITVRGLSSVDFQFEFLEVGTMTAMTSQPIAYEATLTRLSLTNPGCIDNITMLHLYNDAGETILELEFDNNGLNRLSPDDETGTFLIWLNMPDVPFYMSVIGYDVLGVQFQRLSPVRVSPRIFVLSAVNVSTDVLVPGKGYRFRVHIHNRGHPSEFKITGNWDNRDYFKATIIPGVLQVAQDQISHFAVVVNIRPSISLITKGTLTITASRVSDNMTEIMTKSFMAEPRRFLQDKQPPDCTTVSLYGGCRLNVACELQKWGKSVAVTDSVTGVRSVVFLQPPPELFNNVQFTYSMTNRTARADCESTCCNNEVTILVFDYANNSAYCRVTARILDLETTTSLYFNLTLPTNDNMTSSLSISPPPSRSTSFNSFLGNNTPSILTGSSSSSLSASVIAVRHSTSPVIGGQTQYSTGQRTMPNIPENKPTFALTTTNFSITPSYIDAVTTEEPIPVSFIGTVSVRGDSFMTTVKNVVTATDKTMQQQTKGNPTKSNTLKLAAIICGAIAGAGGLAIAVIFVTCMCINTVRRNRLRRRRDNGSDVTMGSSSEYQSDCSSESSSIRMKKVGGRREEILASGQNIVQAQKSHRRSYGNIRKSNMTAGRHDSFYPDAGQSVRDGYTNTDRKSQQLVSVRGGRDTSARREEAEDVIFKCVVVNVYNEAGNQTKVYPTDGFDESINKTSYSPMLRTAGQTYTSMLHVQKQIEEMDKQRKNLASGVTDRDSAPEPDSNTSDRLNVGNGKARTIIHESGASAIERLNIRQDTSRSRALEPGFRTLQARQLSYDNTSNIRESIDGTAGSLRTLQARQLSYDNTSNIRESIDGTAGSLTIDAALEYVPPGSPRLKSSFNKRQNVNETNYTGITERREPTVSTRCHCERCSTASNFVRESGRQTAETRPTSFSDDDQGLKVLAVSAIDKRDTEGNVVLYRNPLYI